MIRDGTAPDESTIPHLEDGMTKLLRESREAETDLGIGGASG